MGKEKFEKLDLNTTGKSVPDMGSAADDMGKLVKHYTELYQTKDTLEIIKERRKINAEVYKKVKGSQNVYETLSLLVRFTEMYGGRISSREEPNDLVILAPEKVRVKINEALKEREEMIDLIISSEKDLAGWKEFPSTYDEHPYLNKVYAPIFAFLKRTGLQIDGSRILEIGFGSLLNAPQEFAEQGAKSYAIDPNESVPCWIQREKLTEGKMSRFTLLNREELALKGIWQKLPKTKMGGQVSFAHATLEESDKDVKLKNGSFDAVYANELYEYGALYFPSKQRSWDYISMTHLNIIFNKLKEGGVFVSRTMVGHGLKIEQLKKIGFEVICYNLPLQAFDDHSDKDNEPDRLRMDRSYIVVCKKPFSKNTEEPNETEKPEK